MTANPGDLALRRTHTTHEIGAKGFTSQSTIHPAHTRLVNDVVVARYVLIFRPIAGWSVIAQAI